MTTETDESIRTGEASILFQPRKILRRDSALPQALLNVEKSKVEDIYVKPGSNEFMVWYISATYLPILAACLGPLANMTSIAALVLKWGELNGKAIPDQTVVIVINSVSLFFGLAANFTLLFNFRKESSYKYSQVLCTGFFSTAGILLLADIIYAQLKYFSEGHSHPKHTKYQGFWFAVMTVILYAGCAFSGALNYSGYLLGKYAPKLNLGQPERGLIIYTFILSIWILWGSWMFQKLFHISYGDAMYFCCVSVLTIGLGDITPQTYTSKGLSFVYNLTGVIIIGLIITMMRGVVVSSAGPVFFWSGVEKRRRAVYARVVKKKQQLTSQEAFELIRSIRMETRWRHKRLSAFYIICFFILYWLIGALIFHFTEGWPYFDGVYFCFLCLITIGYGDYYMTTAAGKAVFVVWSISAVPLMTVLISNVGDLLYGLAISGVKSKFTNMLFAGKSSGKDAVLRNGVEVLMETNDPEVMLQRARSVEAILEEVNANSRLHKKPQSKHELFQVIRKVTAEVNQDPHKRYAFSEWKIIMDLLELETEEDEEQEGEGDYNNLFWISDASPLRLPISEPNFFLFVLFNKLEELVTEETAEIVKKVTTNRSE